MMITAILPLFLLLQAPNSGPAAAPDPAAASTPLAADASDDDQAKKLYALADAMMAKKQACAPKVE